MSSTNVSDLVTIFKDITSNKTCNVSSICSLEKKVDSLNETIHREYGSFSLEFDFAEELLQLIRMAAMAPADYKLSYWLEFGVPDTVRSLEQKLNVIIGGFFNLAI